MIMTEPASRKVSKPPDELPAGLEAATAPDEEVELVKRAR